MTPLKLLAAVLLCSTLLFKEGVEGWGGLSSVPSESECRPYIEKALKEQAPSDSSPEAVDLTSSETEGASTISADQEGSIEETEEATTNESIEDKTSDEIKPENVEESLETEATTENSELASESTAESGEASLAEEAVEEKAESLESTEAQETAEEVKTEESSETGEVTEGEAIDQSVEDAGETLELESTEATSDETQEDRTTAEEQSAETPDESTNEEKSAEEETKEDTQQSSEQANETKDSAEVVEEPKSEEVTASEDTSTEVKSEETQEVSEEAPSVMVEASEEKSESTEENATEESAEATGGEVTDSVEEAEPLEAANDSTETADTIEASPVEEIKESVEETVSSTDVPMEESAQASVEEVSHESVQADEKDASASAEEIAQNQVSDETATESAEPSGEVASESTEQPEAEPKETNETEVTSAEGQASGEGEAAGSGDKPATEQEAPVEIAKEQEPTVEDQLTLEFEAPKVRRSREHIAEILKLNPESAETELLLAKTIESTLKELKRLYDAAIKPLEILYKYRDLSNRHFGDPEIFSKPLILFMGPWSGGKSTILNYLMDNEFKSSSLRTGAEPSPAYFNILMWGEREEVLDGTQLAADWTFSGLQKFGQGLLDRLRGLRLNNPLLEKVNIVEIPGILEIRKQVERLFPFNDACQWFIDRADIIFLVYDPSKLDVGPETEAILDQLKGREYQTRIILNKADQVKPEELMRVQGTLIWNISPLMSSMEPPVMYSTSLWSIPYEQGAPSRLLHAQERAFLRDLRTAIDKRVENKIASARRFAVRVRNHAKMVDCYLTTYYNHKTFFGNRKKVADEIIEHPQNYHIYEGLSTLTNISRYDLPDPEVYRDFFRLNSLYDFQRLSETCTFFRGCPINRLDVSIAYDLPELVGKYKKQAEKVLEQVADKKSKS